MLLPALAALALPPQSARDWPQFRGPDTTGVVESAELPESWTATSVAWSAAVGCGFAQPIVVGGTVFVAEVLGGEPPTGQDTGSEDATEFRPGVAPDLMLEWRLRALELQSGRERWVASVARGRPTQSIHPANTWATETPAADAHGVYAVFGMAGVVAAYDHQGASLWRVEIGTYPWMNGYGSGSSPVLHEGRLFVASFNEERAFVVAFDVRDGREAWRVEVAPGTTWASPLLWRTQERIELVSASRACITGRDLASGKELWRVSGITGPVMTSFAADRERLYFGQRGPRANPPLYALRAGRSGDGSPPADSRVPKDQAWQAENASPSLPSPVSVAGFLYVAKQNLLGCHDAASGAGLYQERVPGLGPIRASPIAVGERLLLLDEEGRAAWVPLGRTFAPVEAGSIEDLFWTTPVVAGDALLLRGRETVYCIRK